MKKKYPKRPPVEIGETYQESCRHCNGNGQEPTLPDLTCHKCMGRGRRKWRIRECKDCDGKGRAGGFLGLGKCKNCQGRGWTALDVG